MDQAEYARMMRRNHLNMLYFLAAIGGVTMASAALLDRIMTKQKPEQKSR